MKLYQILLTILPPCILSFEAPQHYLKFYNTECNFNPKYVANGSCSLKVPGRNLVLANVDYDLITPMKNITVFGKVFKFYNQFRPFLIDEIVNLCKLANPGGFGSYNFFVKLIARIILKSSNTIKCYHEVIFFLFLQATLI